MEVPSSKVVYPTLAQIVHVNRRMIETSGGYFSPPDNFLHRDSLEYVLDAIQKPVFGRFIFSTLTEKASALAYTIIDGHVFFDGNKRTGIHMAWEFLQSNGVNLYLDSTIEEVAIGVATGTTPREQLCSWLCEHIKPLE